MTKLNDLQSILLAAATARDNGSLLPLPDACATVGARGRKALASLLKSGLAIETEVTDATLVHRTDGDIRYGLFLTDAGCCAINVEPSGEGTPANAGPAPASAVAAPRPTKSALVIGLLKRAQGGTLAELIEATGWLPHTTRAALTGLKKKGHVIEKAKRGEVTCYRIAVAA